MVIDTARGAIREGGLELLPLVPVENHGTGGLVISAAPGAGNAAFAVAGSDFLLVLIFDFGDAYSFALREGDADVFPVIASAIDSHIPALL